MSEEPLALVTGINRYPFLTDRQGKPNHLESPARGAEEIAKLLHKYKFHVIRFPCKTVQDDSQVIDPHPSKTSWRKSDLEKKIENLFHPPSGTPPKKALLFFAGHGLLVEEDVFLLTSDAIPDNPGKEKGISLKWLSKLLRESPVEEQIVWLDCCYSGKLLDFFSEQNQDSNDSKKRCFILASRGFESAYEQNNREYGLLSGALIRGLKNPAGFTSKSLKDYIEKELRSKQIAVVDRWSHEITITQIDFDTSTIAPKDWDEIDNNPETLQTIGKYLLEPEYSCWRLSVYEKFLSPQVLTRDDYKATVKSLVDIGVILEDEQGLRIAKGIYKKAFDWEWLQRHLPPYGKSFMDWSGKHKDESHLLQKYDLDKALNWLSDKELLNESEVEFIITSLVWNAWQSDPNLDTNQANNMVAVNIVKEFITRLKSKTNHVYSFIQKCLEHTAIKPKLLEKVLELVCQSQEQYIDDSDRFIQEQIELIHRNEILNSWIRAYEEKISETYLDYPCPDNPKTIIDRAFYEFVQAVTRHLQLEEKFSTVEECINSLSDCLINEQIWNEDERPTIEATEHDGKKIWKITVAQCSYKEECKWALKEPKFTQNGQYRCQRLGCCVGAVKSLNDNLETNIIDYLMTTVMDEQEECQGLIFFGDRNLKMRESLTDKYSTKFPTEEDGIKNTKVTP